MNEKTAVANTSTLRQPQSAVNPKRRKAYYNTNWEENHKWITKGSSNLEAKCKLCLTTFSVEYSGYSAVKKHSESIAHKNKISNTTGSTSLTNFFVKSGSDIETKVVLAEVVQVYHCIKHNQSYNSIDYSMKLGSTIFFDSSIANKLSCGRTKCQAIAENVLGKKALAKVLCEINDHKPKLFYAIQLDASNRKNVKLFPISVQFFTVENGLQNYLLDFVENADETADGMYKMVEKCINELQLNWQNISSLSADNTNSNFGKNHSLFTNIKSKNKNIQKANCHAHIIHNCVKDSLDSLDVDVENIILKIYSHFSNSAKRRETLKGFHDFVNSQWRELIKHVGTRWLSLNPCIERILLNYTALCSYFLSMDDCPKQIKQLLKIDNETNNVTPEIEIYLLFTNHILLVFDITVKKLESNQTTSLDLFDIMNKLRADINNRLENSFYGHEVNKKLKNLSTTDRIAFQNDFNSFYQKSVKYLETRFDFSETNWLSKISVLSLPNNTFPKYKDFEIILEELNNSNLCINMDQLFDEVMLVQNNFAKISQHTEFTNFSTAGKWQHILSCNENMELINMFNIISFF